MAMLSGGDVKLAAEIALATSVCAWIYYKGQGENPRYDPTVEPKFKAEGEWATSEYMNVGISRSDPGSTVEWYHEHSGFMRAIGKIPIFNAMGTIHDNLVKILPAIKPLWDCGIAKYTPGHVVMLAITFGADAANKSAYYRLPR
jgi:hypothetical protein